MSEEEAPKDPRRPGEMPGIDIKSIYVDEGKALTALKGWLRGKNENPVFEKDPRRFGDPLHFYMDYTDEDKEGFKIISNTNMKNGLRNLPPFYGEGDVMILMHRFLAFLPNRLKIGLLPDLSEHFKFSQPGNDEGGVPPVFWGLRSMGRLMDFWWADRMEKPERALEPEKWAIMTFLKYISFKMVLAFKWIKDRKDLSPRLVFYADDIARDIKNETRGKTNYAYDLLVYYFLAMNKAGETKITEPPRVLVEMYLNFWSSEYPNGDEGKPFKMIVKEIFNIDDPRLLNINNDSIGGVIKKSKFFKYGLDHARLFVLGMFCAISIPPRFSNINVCFNRVLNKAF